MKGYEVHLVVVGAAIGGKALYLLFIWLISGAAASWMSDRKGYGERVGLMLGLLLSAVGLLIVLLLPGRPGSKWRADAGCRDGAVPFERGGYFKGTTPRRHGCKPGLAGISFIVGGHPLTARVVVFLDWQNIYVAAD